VRWLWRGRTGRRVSGGRIPLRGESAPESFRRRLERRAPIDKPFRASVHIPRTEVWMSAELRKLPRPGRRSVVAPRAPSVLYCFLLLAAVKLLLRCLGLARTLLWLQKRAGSVPATGVVHAVFPARAAYRIALAGAFYPGRARCLEQSLALSYALWRAGLPAYFHLGVQPRPFAAHAWVEYLGEPLNDSLEHVRWFAPVHTRPV
jgi:hypothetical protein